MALTTIAQRIKDYWASKKLTEEQKRAFSTDTRKVAGVEMPDTTPIEIPAGFKRPETLHEQIARLIRDENFRASIQNQGFETIDEADDFDVDDPDPTDWETRYTIVDMLQEPNYHDADDDTRGTSDPATGESTGDGGAHGAASDNPGPVNSDDASRPGRRSGRLPRSGVAVDRDSGEPGGDLGQEDTERSLGGDKRATRTVNALKARKR